MYDKDIIIQDDEECGYVNRLSEPQINKGQKMQNIKDILINSSRKGSKFSIHSANIINELFLSKLKIKSESKQRLNNYKESLDQKILMLKEKIANSTKIQYISQPFTLSPNIVMPNFLNFIQSNPKSGVNIISFLSTNDLYHCIKLKQFKMALVNIFQSVISIKIKEKFILKYHNLFSNTSFTLCFQQYKRHKKLNTRIIIGITSQLRHDNDTQINMKPYMNQTICLKYMTHYPHSHTKIVNSFVFDLYAYNTPNTYWIFKEVTPFHFDDHKTAYYSNIISFNMGDTIKLSIDVFTDNGLISIDKFHWNKILTTPIAQYDLLQASVTQNPKDQLSTLRLCEVEGLKNSWRDISHFDDYDLLLKSIMTNFEDKFEIEQIFFDDVGYYLFKVILKAKSAGVLNNSLEIGIYIEVLDENATIENIVKKNNLVFDGRNELRIRIGDVVVFYLSFQKE